MMKDYKVEVITNNLECYTYFVEDAYNTDEAARYALRKINRFDGLKSGVREIRINPIKLKNF